MYQLLDLSYIGLDNPGIGQLSSSASSHGKIKKRGIPLRSVKQVATKIAKVYYLGCALNLFHNF